MPLSELQIRKFKRFFRVFDLNQDGTIQREDYIMLAENLARTKGFGPDSALATRLKETFTIVWENLAVLADKNHDHKVTFSEYLEYREKLHQDEHKYRDLVTATLAIFDLLDSDHNGKIDMKEFVIFYKLFNLDESAAQDIFKKLDTDEDGYLTRLEVIRLRRDFDMSDDPEAVGNWLFGEF